MADPRAGVAEAARPLILLANPDVWFRDSIESVLLQDGFRVVTADTGPRAIELAQRDRPDAVILDIAFQPQWPDAYAVCRALCEGPDPILSPAVPVILTTPGPALRAQQLEALRHGAWDLRGDPLDMEDLSLRLRAYTQGKLAADRARRERVLDQGASYAALMTRQGQAFACVVFAPRPPLADAAAIERLARAFRRTARASDAVGQTGAEEFTLFAPATDAAGAERLVVRLSAAVRKAFGNGGAPLELRTGVSVMPAGSDAGVSGNELWTRARAALAENR